MPILGQQPPLLVNAAVILVQNEGGGHEKALVPAYPYF